MIHLLIAAQLMVPASQPLHIAGGVYEIRWVDGITAAQRSDVGPLRLTAAASTVLCEAGGGVISVDSHLSPPQQAKALIHEVVHIAQHCDHRRIAVEERVSQDVADLFDSPIGPFVIRELGR